jgi:integrase
LKAFFAWMRKRRHLLSRQEDCTLDLEVPARRPEQWRRPKAIPRAQYLRVLAAIEQPHRDSLALLDETGWHVSELARFARGGSLEPLPKGKRTDKSVIVAVVPLHKSGSPLRSALGKEAAEVAQRVLARGGFSVGRFYDAVKAANAKVGGAPFTPGRARHTFATRAVEAGADPSAVSTYLGHKSEATMRRFYSTLAVQPRPGR